MKIILLLFSILSISTLSNAQVTEGKKAISNDSYAVHFDKKTKEIFIYDDNKILLNSYRCKHIPKFKNRMKYIHWANPKETFTESSNTGLGVLYDLEDYLVFSFNTKIGELSALQLLLFDKQTYAFELKRMIFPNAIGSKSNNSYIWNGHLFTVQINQTALIAQIRSLQDPDHIVKEYLYEIDKPLSPANTSILKSTESDFLFSSIKNAKTYDGEKEQKGLKKLINKGSYYGAKIKPTPLSNGLLEICLGTHIVINNTNPGMATNNNVPAFSTNHHAEKLWYFKLIVDSDTFTHIPNDQLKEENMKPQKEDFKHHWNQ